MADREGRLMGLTVCRSNTSTWEKKTVWKWDICPQKSLNIDWKFKKQQFLCPLMLLKCYGFLYFEKIRILQFFFFNRPTFILQLSQPTNKETEQGCNNLVRPKALPIIYLLLSPHKKQRGDSARLGWALPSGNESFQISHLISFKVTLSRLLLIEFHKLHTFAGTPCPGQELNPRIS